MSDLNKKQLLFIDELFKCKFNQTQAAINSGYSKKTAAEQASRLLTNVNIKAEIDRRQKAIAKKNEYSQELHLKSNKKMIQTYDLLLDLAMQPRLDPEEEAMFARLMLVLKASDANKAKEITNKMLGWEKKSDESDEDPEDDNEITVNIVR